VTAPSAGDSFGSCCSELSEALAAEGFDPLVTVADNGVIYMTVGLVDADGGEAALVDHPMFFCPFCGTALQTREDVKQKIAAGDGG
jgi:hypothetical protein